MADATTADPTNAVEVAALLTEAAEAGTAVEAMRIVFSTTVGAQFAERSIAAKSTAATPDAVQAGEWYVSEGVQPNSAVRCVPS